MDAVERRGTDVSILDRRLGRCDADADARRLVAGMLGLLLGTVEALMRDVSSMDRVILGLHPA